MAKGKQANKIRRKGILWGTGVNSLAGGIVGVYKHEIPPTFFLFPLIGQAFWGKAGF